MPFTSFPLNDGNTIPAIAFGTGTVFRERDVAHYVEQAIEVGFDHVDTAQVYANEKSVGQGIRESGLDRDQLYVTTKYGGGNVRTSFRDSLDKLGLKFVDLYLIHFPPPPNKGNIEEVWREFEIIKSSGSSKSIGVSNFNLEQLQNLVKIAHIKPAVNQIRFHPYNYHANKPLLEYASKHGIIIEAYSSLSPITKLPGGPVDAALEAAAKKRGASPTQIILAWVRAKGAVVVTTSSSKQHLQEYLDAGDIEPLTSDEISAIDEAGAKGHPGSGLGRLFRFYRPPYLFYLCKCLSSLYHDHHRSMAMGVRVMLALFVIFLFIYVLTAPLVIGN